MSLVKITRALGITNQRNPCNFNSLLYNISIRRYCNSNSNNYTVDEVIIPIPSIGGHLAGKLWQGKNTQSSSTKEITPIICMHGIQDNCGSFDPLIPLILRDNMKIFAVDLPGHGLSYQTKDLTYHAFFDGLSTIKRVLHHYQWDKVTLLGHSLGAVISFIYSSCFPENVHRYIAMDNFRPIPREDPTHAFQNAIKSLFEIDAKLSSPKSERPSYTYEELLSRTIQSRKNTVTSLGCETLLKRGSIKLPGNSKYQFTHDIKTNIPTSYRFLSTDQVEAMAKRIQCPVCIIKGDPGEDYEPREKFLETVQLVKDNTGSLEYHSVKGTHHFHLNEPHLVAPIINNFIHSS